MYYSTTCPSPIGTLTLAGSENGLAGLWIEGQKYFGHSISGEMIRKDNLEIFKTARDWLDRYFDGRRPSVKELPISPAGSGFRRDVWDLLRDSLRNRHYLRGCRQKTCRADGA